MRVAVIALALCAAAPAWGQQPFSAACIGKDGLFLSCPNVITAPPINEVGTPEQRRTAMLLELLRQSLPYVPEGIAAHIRIELSKEPKP